MDWGTLVEDKGTLKLVRKPIWHETTAEYHIRLLHRIAMAGTRVINRKFEITFDDIVAWHLFWLRQPKQKQKSWCHIGQNSVFAPKSWSIVGHIDEMHKIARVRS